MQIYFPNLQAIEQQSHQLELEQCRHCQQTHQLVSHGFIRKKHSGGEPLAVGKRVFCSNRYHHTGCGRTMQLCLDSAVRWLHYAGSFVVAFVLALMSGTSIDLAYTQSTGACSPRHAYRWLQRLRDQTSTYRSCLHLPLLTPSTTGGDAAPCPPSPSKAPPRRHLLTSTFTPLLSRFAQPLCQTYQSELQRSFL